MDNYKGIYYGQITETKSFEGGAHFRYKDLYQVLLSLYNTLPEDRVGSALHYSSTSELKQTQNRNAAVSFNVLPVTRIHTEEDNKNAIPLPNVKSFINGNCITEYNDKRTRNHNHFLQPNPITNNTNEENMKCQRRKTKHECIFMSETSDNIHKRQRSAFVMINGQNNCQRNINMTYHKSCNGNNSGNLNNLVYKMKKKREMLMLTDENNNNNIHNKRDKNSHTRLLKPKIKSIKYKLQNAPLLSVSSSDCCQNNSLYSILKKPEQEANTTDDQNKNFFHVNMKKQFQFKFKPNAGNFSLLKSNNKSSSLNLSNLNHLGVNNNNAGIIQAYNYREQKSRNEKQSEMLACSKGFKTDVMYNQRMLKNMYHSHIQYMQNQMISMNSKSKDKTNNKEKKDEKGFINNSLLYLKHVKSESNNIHKGRKLGLQGITNRSGYQKSLVFIGNNGNNINNNQGKFLKFKKLNHKLLSNQK